MQVLLPKAQADQPRWQAALADCGHRLLWVDPWQFEVLAEKPAVRTAWLNLDLFDGVICVSPFAARLLLEAIDQYWPMFPIRVQWWCNGPGTASVLEEGGLHAQFPAKGNTAEDLLCRIMPGVKQGSRWLVIQGENGRELYSDALQGSGASVTTLNLYRRRTAATALQQMVELSSKTDAILISSMTLLDALMRRDATYWQDWPGLWLLTSKRLQKGAIAHSLHGCECLSGASPEAVRQALLNKPA